MAITCPECGAEFDATLFQFGHAVRCDCGGWVELERGHVIAAEDGGGESRREPLDEQGAPPKQADLEE